MLLAGLRAETRVGFLIFDVSGVQGGGRRRRVHIDTWGHLFARSVQTRRRQPKLHYPNPLYQIQSPSTCPIKTKKVFSVGCLIRWGKPSEESLIPLGVLVCGSLPSSPFSPYALALYPSFQSNSSLFQVTFLYIILTTLWLLQPLF